MGLLKHTSDGTEGKGEGRGIYIGKYAFPSHHLELFQTFDAFSLILLSISTIPCTLCQLNTAA